MLAPDLRSEVRWLASGYLLNFSSGFGQTYFIALFAGHLKAELAISDGQFGGLYTLGTLASACLLIWAGKAADIFPIRWLGVGVMAGLALTALAMASVANAWMLAFVLFGLRFFGQGMLTHVAMTAMARWFNRKRGRALSIASLGLPSSEATLPLIIVALIGLVGWRMTWVAVAAALIVLLVPLLIALLKRERIPTVGGASPEHTTRPMHRQWTRGEVIRSPLFYALVPGILTSPFVLTGILFNQVTIVEAKGWQLSWFAASFPVMAGASILSALMAGWLVDRFGARRLVAIFLVPIGLASLAMAGTANAAFLPVIMAVIGLSLGGSNTVWSAVWAELYGTEHLGAIRALATAAVVFASALSPGLIGALLDAGIALESQLAVMGAACFAVALWTSALIPRLNRLAEA